MNKLLIIDPQNDFCDVAGAALPVTGASADVARIAGFIDQIAPKLGAISVTLDSHPVVAIERPGFWQTGTGAQVEPFTEIKAADVRAQRFVPRTLALQPHALAYLTALEQGSKYTLMVWPAHCVLGTWGHAMPADLAQALARWEVCKQVAVNTVLKGLNPLTEQYSAVRAEVPVEGDYRTERNTDLIAAVTPTPQGLLLVAGEALSHCVRATMLDLFPTFTPAQLSRTVLLQDCMSSVTGFETQGREFLEFARTLGVQTMTAAKAARLLVQQAE